jgi:hypothetical protein
MKTRVYVDRLRGDGWKLPPKLTARRSPWGFGAGLRLFGLLISVHWVRGS